MNELNWMWIGLMVTVPPLLAVLVAYPFWRQTAMIFGNLTGAAVIFAASFALILREHAELNRLVQACVDAGLMCEPDPSAFARHAIYACIGLVEVFALFVLSLPVERSIRNRLYAPEWR